MVINVISNLGPLASVGLERDYLILKSFLESHNHVVRAIDVYSPPVHESAGQADLNIWIETLHDPRYLTGYAKSNWLLVNPEWWHPDWNRYLPSLSLICCKTKHAYEIWSRKVGTSRCLYTAFESPDRCQPGIVRQRSFLAVSGKSCAKGTDVVLDAWRRYSIPVPLTIVTCSRTEAERASIGHLMLKAAGLPNVRNMHNLSDELLTIEYNRSQFFIQPSLYEGFSLSAHEAMSCRAVILTTDAPPMNEFPGVPDRESGLLIPVSRTEPRMDVTFSYTNREDVYQAVKYALTLPEPEIEKLAVRARHGWEHERDHFRAAFGKAIKGWYSYL